MSEHLPRLRRWIRAFGALVAFVGLVGLSAADHVARRREQLLEREAVAALREAALRSAERLAEEAQQAQDAVGALGLVLARGPAEPEVLSLHLQELAGAFPAVYDVGVAPAPVEGVLPWAPLCRRQREGGCAVFDLTQRLDYTRLTPRTAWYADAVLSGGGWGEPVGGDVGSAGVVPYTQPFCWGLAACAPAQEPEGAVVASLDLGSLRTVLQRARGEVPGFAFVLSPTGRFVVHPQEEHTREGLTLFDEAWRRGDGVLHGLAVEAIGGGRGVYVHDDPYTGQRAWFAVEPVPGTPWALVQVRPRDGLVAPATLRRRRLVLLALGSLVLMGGAVLWSEQRSRSGRGLAWALSGSATGLLALNIGMVWAIADAHPSALVQGARAIVDQAALADFLDEHSRSRAEGAAPLYVRTGVFLQSVEFDSANNVSVSGVLWQRYDLEDHADLERGVVLPEAAESTLEEAWRREEGGQEHVGWTFTATLRQDFDYSAYPLDRQEVWLRLRHPDLERDVVLVPDLEAYPRIHPRLMPGVEDDLVLPGWGLEGSGFEYRDHRYNTSFGFPSFAGLEGHPELFFTVRLRRSFLGPFVSSVIPLLVVGVMVFSTLLTSTKDERHASWFGFTANAAVAGCAALFFVVIFDHSSLREEIPGARVMYLEYFYFTMYVALLGVTVNSIVFAQQEDVPLIHSHDNLIAKVLFWPAYLGAMAGLTYWTFA